MPNWRATPCTCPSSAVQFHLESAAAMRSVSLVATGDQQSYSHWRRLHSELAAALESLEVPPNPRGFTLLAAGVLLLGWPLVQLLRAPPKAVAQQLLDMLGL